MKLIKCNEKAILPTKKNSQDAGFDLYTYQAIIIPPQSQKIVPIGWKLAGYSLLLCDPYKIVYQIWPKSGLDSKYGLHTGSGLIDSNYRGEILVLLKNTSNTEIILNPGSQIAQIVPVIICQDWIEEVSENTLSDRGEDGGILRDYLGVLNESGDER